MRSTEDPADASAGGVVRDSIGVSEGSLPQNGTEEVRLPSLSAWRTSPTTDVEITKPSSAYIDWESARTNV
jgi:hypothetical protein